MQDTIASQQVKIQQLEVRNEYLTRLIQGYDSAISELKIEELNRILTMKKRTYLNRLNITKFAVTVKNSLQMVMLFVTKIVVMILKREINMELITLKEASRITSLSYTYLYENKSKLGFFQVNNKGKWLADKRKVQEYHDKLKS